MAENEPRDNQQDGPIRAKHDRKFNFQWLIDCKVNIVSESQARDIIIEMDPAQPVRFLTEKTFKPMAYGMPFMIFGIFLVVSIIPLMIECCYKKITSFIKR